MSQAKFEETVSYLYDQLPMFQRDGGKAFKKDLTNTLQLCEVLGHPQHQFKSVHIAGTNGKGSSSHYMAAILQSAGYKTGLYISPHLKSFTERIKIDGKEVEQRFVVDFVERIKPHIDTIKPSFFEITVVMAFDYFARKKVDIAVIEVGMGGRLDSTNVILPEACLITNISMDHQQWLGNTLEAIAGEKAGIIKNHIPVVVSEYQSECISVFEKKAQDSSSQLFLSEHDISFIKHEDEYRFGNIVIPADVPEYQFKNLKGVLSLIAVLNERGFVIKEDHISKGIHDMKSLTNLKGRWQQLGECPWIFCDVGHNEAGLKELMRQINKYKYNQLYFVIGVVEDKDLNKIMPLLPSEAYYICCQPHIKRALPAQKLYEQLLTNKLRAKVVEDVNDALKWAKNEADNHDMIIVAGSNFVVAEINEL